VTTLGDVSRAQLTQIGGTGVFVSALREALLAGEVDLAVHSLKDLPAGPAAGVVLAAVPPRDDPRDALAARDGAKLADLPAGARIGTGSPRRAAQLLALRGDLRCVPVRGNAGTRLGKVGEGDLDGVVLACAGLARIGSLGAVTQVFEPDEMLPAPGQGALAVECRDGEPELAALLGAVTDQVSLAAVTAERSLLEALEAGCSAPIGAYAAVPAGGPGGTGGGSPPCGKSARGVRGDGVPLGVSVVAPGQHDQLRLQAAVMSTDGRRVLRAHGTAAAADARLLGRDLAAELLRAGASDLIIVPQAPTSSGNDVQ
jgi:hydroxymethylbilane synthase